MDPDIDARAPPKKAHLEVTTKEKSEKQGKENKTPSRLKKGAKKRGSSILMGAQMAKVIERSSPVQTENSSAESPKPQGQTENPAVPVSPTQSLSAQPQRAATFNSSLDDSFLSVASSPSPLPDQTAMSPYDINVNQSDVEPGKRAHVYTT